jgi:hypothetical protein
MGDGSTGMMRSTTRRAHNVQTHHAQMLIAEAAERIHSEVVRFRKCRLAHPRDLCMQRTRGRPEGRKTVVEEIYTR